MGSVEEANKKEGSKAAPLQSKRSKGCTRKVREAALEAHDMIDSIPRKVEAVINAEEERKINV